MSGNNRVKLSVIVTIFFLRVKDIGAGFIPLHASITHTHMDKSDNIDTQQNK